MTKQPPRVTLDTPLGPDVDLDVDEARTRTGHRLTEQDVAELVDDARAKVGRPSLTAPGERSPQVTLRLPADLLGRLDAEAERRGVRRSTVVRDLLDQHLAS